MKNYSYILCLLIAISIFSCKSDQPAKVEGQSKEENATTTTETKSDEMVEFVTKDSPITKLPKEFPQAFKDLSIPEFKNATYERVFRHNHATTPKIQVGFSSSSTPKDIEAFYIKSLERQGWKNTKTSNPQQKEGVHIAIFKKDNKQLVFNAIPHPKEKRTVATMILFDI